MKRNFELSLGIQNNSLTSTADYQGHICTCFCEYMINMKRIKMSLNYLCVQINKNSMI